MITGPLFILISLLSNICLIEAGNGCDDINLSDLIRNGKWISYDFVNDDCLVLEFLKFNPSLNFHRSSKELHQLANRNMELDKLQLEQMKQSEFNYDSRMKFELHTKATKRRLDSQRLELNKLKEITDLNVALIESEIRDLMDRCLRRASEINGDYRSICSNQFSELETKVGNLCSNLLSNLMLLKAQILVHGT